MVPFSQPNTGAAAILVDKLYAGDFESAAYSAWLVRKATT
jgi:hypothetical protein